MKLISLKPKLSTLDARSAKPPPKEVEPLYQSPEFKVWRKKVVSRAGRRCERLTDDVRCWKAEPAYRMYADHVVEVRDGGARFDPANGECLCAAHHGLKTAEARARRR